MHPSIFVRTVEGVDRDVAGPVSERVARGGDALPAVGGREQLHVEIVDHQLNLAPQLRQDQVMQSILDLVDDDEPAPDFVEADEQAEQPRHAAAEGRQRHPLAGGGRGENVWLTDPVRDDLDVREQGKDDAQRPLQLLLASLRDQLGMVCLPTSADDAGRWMTAAA